MGIGNLYQGKLGSEDEGFGELPRLLTHPTLYQEKYCLVNTKGKDNIAERKNGTAAARYNSQFGIYQIDRSGWIGCRVDKDMSHFKSTVFQFNAFFRKKIAKKVYPFA